MLLHASGSDVKGSTQDCLLVFFMFSMFFLNCSLLVLFFMFVLIDFMFSMCSRYF